MAARTHLLRLANGAAQTRTFTSHSAVLRQEAGAGNGDGARSNNSQPGAARRARASSTKHATDFAFHLNTAITGPAGSIVRDADMRRKQDDTSVYGGQRYRHGEMPRPNQRKGGGSHRPQGAGAGGGGGGGGNYSGSRGGYRDGSRRPGGSAPAQAGAKGNERFAKRRGAPSSPRSPRGPKRGDLPLTINGAQKLTGTDWALADVHPLHTPYAHVPYKEPRITLQNLRLGPPEKSSAPLKPAADMLRAKFVPKVGLITRVQGGARFGISDGALPLRRLPNAGEGKPLADELKQLRILELQESQGGDYRRMSMQDALRKKNAPIEQTALHTLVPKGTLAPSHIDFTLDTVRTIIAKAGGHK